MLFLNNYDIEQILTIEDCQDAIEDAYRELAKGDAANFPESGRVEMYTASPGPEEELDRAYNWGAMAALLRNPGVMAIRMKSDIEYRVEHSNGNLTSGKYSGAPGTWCGLIFMYSIRDGRPLAIFNDGVVQHMRVAATAIAAAKYLARNDSETLGIFGSGGMAHSHAEALATVFPIKRIQVFSPTKVNREAFAREMQAKLDITVEPLERPELVIEGADVLAACTNSRNEVVQEEWARPGMHITRVGPNEVGPWIEQKADVLVRHLSADPTGGVIRTVVGKREKSPRDRNMPAIASLEAPTLADLVSGRAQGRTRDDQITYFYNSPGSGLQFAAACARAYQRAVERGVGRELPDEWFLQDIPD